MRQILPELQARAAAGEAPAACRLAQELDRCARLKEHQRAAAEAIAASQREGLFGDILRRRHDLAEKAQARFYEIAAACEDVAPEVAVQAWRHILSAARAGHGPSMALYVAHRGFLDGHEPLAVLDGWIAFRDEGPQFLRRAVEMGEPGVYPIAAVAYGTGQWFGLKVERDPALALALTLARARAIPGSDTRTLETIVMAAGQRWNASADDIARGQQLADDYAERLRARLAQRPAQSGPASSCDP